MLLKQLDGKIDVTLQLENEFAVINMLMTKLLFYDE